MPRDHPKVTLKKKIKKKDTQSSSFGYTSNDLTTNKRFFFLFPIQLVIPFFFYFFLYDVYSCTGLMTHSFNYRVCVCWAVLLIAGVFYFFLPPK